MFNVTFVTLFEHISHAYISQCVLFLFKQNKNFNSMADGEEQPLSY